MAYEWDKRAYYTILKEWRKRRDFKVREWLDTKTIKAKPRASNGGVVGNVHRSYKDKDPGIYTLNNVFNSKSDPGAGGGGSSGPSFLFLPLVGMGSTSGPLGSLMSTAYAGLALSPVQGQHQGKQRWTVPSSGTYQFEIGGAGGGAGGNKALAGDTLGAKVVFTADLTAGDLIEVAVGVVGGSHGGAHGNEHGGGGATWVYNFTTSTLLGVAGGAGGVPSNQYGGNCTRDITKGHGSDLEVPDYTACQYTPSVPSGGHGGTASGGYHGGAGGGFVTNGANGGTHCATATGGASWGGGLIGGVGNTCYTTLNRGGFGGGGGGQLGGPGAAGGYTGGRSSGNWSSYSTYGGGGGSYVHPTACTLISKTLGGNNADPVGAPSNAYWHARAGYCQLN